MTPLLELRGLTRSFDLRRGPMERLLRPAIRHLAVDGVDLAVQRGAALGLVGESGCGKSTLARLILRLDEPSAGEVRLDGTDLVPLRGPALRPWRRRMQMVFQDSGASLNPRKPVRHLLDEALAATDVPKPQRRERAAALLDQVGLDSGLLERYPHELSGGQRQRTAIARALATGPDLLVADEPVASLDVSLQAQILLLLMGLRKRLGLTMVFITHDLALVHHLCSDMAVMSAGRIVEQGSTVDVLGHPRHHATQRLLAAVPRGRRPATARKETA